MTSWLSVIFWYSIIGDDKDASMVAVLVESYKLAANQNVGVVWALLLLVAILASGAITLVIRQQHRYLIFFLNDNNPKLVNVVIRSAVY